LAEEFEGQVAFVGVSNNDTVEDGKRYRDDFGVPYPLAHAPEVWEQFDVPYQPVTIVLDAEGNERLRVDGPISHDQLLEILKELT
jgi:hypothetical protein